MILKQVSISSFQVNFVLKIKHFSNAMKFGTQSRPNMLTMNMIIGITDLGQKIFLKIYEIQHSEQIEHDN